MRNLSNLFGGRGPRTGVAGVLVSVVLGIGLAACEPAELDQAAVDEAPAVEEADNEMAWAEGAAADHYRDTRQNLGEDVQAMGKDVYDGLCAGCHETGVNRAPLRYLVAQMTPEAIYHAMTEGVMQIQTEGLSDEEKLAVAQYIPGRKFGASEIKAPLMCEGAAADFDRSETPVFEGWGLEPRNAHFITNEEAGITKGNVGTLKLKWAVAFPNASRARSQPALAGGAIYVGSHDGTVFALDRETGCTRWTFKASAEVRTGIVVSPWEVGDESADPLVFFGDLIGNAYAVKAFTGELVWRKVMEDHGATTLTGTATLYNDTLYVPVSSLEEGVSSNPDYQCCTFRGSMVALEPQTGAEKWRTYMIDRPAAPTSKKPNGDDRLGPSGAPIWSSAAIDEKRGLIILTIGDNYSSPATELSDAIVALDLESGDINWAYQATENDVWNGGCEEVDKSNCPHEDGPDFDFGAGAILVTASDGKDYVLAGQKSGIAWGLNADDGALVWKNKVGRGGVVAGIHFGMAATGDTLFVPVSDVPDGNEYTEPPRPGMYALDVKTGEYVWKAPSEDICGGKAFCHPGYSGAISSTPELVIAGANDGYLRIYDAANGEVLWAFDTDREFETVNGAPGHGGSMGGGTAPILYQGDLIMNSGYGFAGKMPGNVLLVFEAE